MAIAITLQNSSFNCMSIGSNVHVLVTRLLSARQLAGFKGDGEIDIVLTVHPHVMYMFL